MREPNLHNAFQDHKELSLKGRYIHLDSIAPLLHGRQLKSFLDTSGYSVNNLPIYSLTLGKGKKKVLLWSQMHGNESTTTKAIFDLLNVLFSVPNHDILEHCTLKIIPILNPDGAKVYTRLNANQVDLNRDALELSQPESKTLRKIYNEFSPDYCFNLHGQRTIYSAGALANSATVSFLAPAQDAARSITSTRKKAMEIISVINKSLQKVIPGQVGRYDDSFNLNCVGDLFQSFETPTILFEAGHFPDDYQREKTREYLFMSMITALDYIANQDITGESFNEYFEIPENEKFFFDILIRNTSQDDIGILFQEVLKNEQIEFIPKIEKISNLSTFFGHREIDANKNQVFGHDKDPIIEGNEIDFVSIKNEKFSLKLKKI
ncbi:MAG: peptidase M14 [Psychroserpens sp.]|nr:peptidase M14 [Psychroserpens sp.]